jgi:hypothetical protein
MAQAAQQIDYTLILNEMANRIRVLEAKQATFAEKLLMVNQNMLDEYKKVMKDIKIARDEVTETKNEIGKVKGVVKHFSDEAAKFAKQDDVKVLQKYVQFWNPMKFVTDKEVEILVKRAMGKKVEYEIEEPKIEESQEFKSKSIEEVLGLLKEGEDAARDSS